MRGGGDGEEMDDMELNFVKNQRTPAGVKTALLAYFEQPRAHKSRTTGLHAHVSEALKCGRQVGLRMMLRQQGAGEATIWGPPSLQRGLAFSIGAHVHELIQAAMANQHDDFQAEVYLSEGFLTGYADGVYTAQGLKTVLEVKTVTPFAYRQGLRGEPLPEHLAQAMIYGLLLEADQVHIVYVHKAPRYNEEPLLEFVLPVDKALAQAEIARLKRLVKQVEGGVVPAREYQGRVITDPDEEKFPCQFCQFKPLCQTLPDGVAERVDLTALGE